MTCSARTAASKRIAMVSLNGFEMLLKSMQFILHLFQHVAAMHRLLPKDRVHVIERDMTTFRQRRTKRSFFNDSLDLQKAYDSRIRAAIAAASGNAPPS